MFLATTRGNLREIFLSWRYRQQEREKAEEDSGKIKKKKKKRGGKLRKILRLQNWGGLLAAVKMGKCRNYLAAISRSYCSSGLLSVYEDSPCSCILDLTLTSHAVVSNSRGDPANIINSAAQLCCENLLCGGFTWLCLRYICCQIAPVFIIGWCLISLH